MRIVLQRVSSASVEVDGKVCGKIGTGFLLLFGVGHDDTEDDCRRLGDKIINLRIFSDENGRINRSLADVDGELLIVPQFTLYADCRHGNRPNFIQAGKPDKAEQLFNYFTDYCRSNGKHAETGIFGADMKVSLTNDGPFTLVLE